jgi:hypothetical protein
MRIHQLEIWKTRPPDFQTDHWFVVISPQERCDEPRQAAVNGLACFTLRGAAWKSGVPLNSAEGFSPPAMCQCDFIYGLLKSKLRSCQGMASWERQQQIKAKLREVFRLL